MNFENRIVNQKELSARTRSALDRHGLKTVEDLLGKEYDEVRMYHLFMKNCGIKTKDEILNFYINEHKKRGDNNMLKITVSQTPSQNEIKGHWKLWNKREKYRKELNNYGFILKVLKSKIKTKKVIKITRFSTRLLDYGNLVGGCKPLLDAMKINGLIVDDSPQWLADNYLQEICKKGLERTELIIEDLEV